MVSSEGTWLGGDITTTAKTLAVVHDDAATKAWFYPVLAERLRRGDPAGNAEFIRRIDTPTRVIIELIPQQWITYDGTRLEASLRGIDHHVGLRKRTRSITEPPEGFEMEYL